MGTIDQALLAVLRVRHVFVRAFALAGKTVVIDEVHAYDTYMSTLIERLLEWLGALRCGVVLLSATLPRVRVQALLAAYQAGATGSGDDSVAIELEAYPRITWSSGDRAGSEQISATTAGARTLAIRWYGGGDPHSATGASDLASWLARQLDEGGCVAIVCNTVARAQEFYIALRDEFGGEASDGLPALELLHGRLLAHQREAVEERVLARFGAAADAVRPHRAVLVATQVVEQSLDLRIDALVAKKRLLIERLEEYCTALVTRTVTRGLPPEAARAAHLDPSPHLKPSGVEWLGEVPEHWEVLPTKHASRIVMGQSPPSDTYQDEPVERPFLQGNAEFGPSSPTPKWYCDAAPKVVEAGALLLSVRAPVGALNAADQTYGIGRGLCGVVANPDRLEQRFAWWTLHVTRRALEPLAVGSTYDAVSAAEVGELCLPLPPLDEQRAIAAYLDRETERIDALVAKKRLLIERLEEYRTALITAAVTGKIDVRE